MELVADNLFSVSGDFHLVFLDFLFADENGYGTLSAHQITLGYHHVFFVNSDLDPIFRHFESIAPVASLFSLLPDVGLICLDTQQFALVAAEMRVVVDRLRDLDSLVDCVAWDTGGE